MSHLQVFPQDPEEPAGALRVWDGPAAAWILEDATDEQVLAALAAAGAERAASAGVKAIARARLENPTPPEP